MDRGAQAGGISRCHYYLYFMFAVCGLCISTLLFAVSTVTVVPVYTMNV